MLSQIALKRTPLYQNHQQLNAKIVPFGGWEMPLQYEGIVAEYRAARQGVAVFDTSHMGEFIVEGSLKDCGLDGIVTQRLDDLAIGSCRYGMMLNEAGGVMDDLIVYRLAAERWMIVVNGATMESDEAQFLKFITDQGKFINVSMATGKLDIQGPGSRDLLKKFISGFEGLSFYNFCETKVLGEKAIVSRTGYTGELGYEIYFPWGRTPELWEKVIALGAKPAGLGSRDVLRLEMGYSLYGHELSEAINPLEAGLARFIHWDKGFVGKKALLKEKAEGAKRSLIAFESTTRRSPRADFKIFDAEKREIGIVTSGTFSPALERGIGLGLVAADTVARGNQIFLGADQQNIFEAVVTTRPFYKNGSLKN